MATGSITTLGLGSGLELQSIVDQLKEADKVQITSKKSQKKELETKIEAYNSVNAKLFAMKSDALSLSLKSEFLNNTITLADEEIGTATVNDGVASSSFTLDVTQKARYNSWQTIGVASADALIYTEPETGITSKESAVTTQTETMSILYGAAENQQVININLDSGMGLTEISEAINSSAANQTTEGKQAVTARVVENNGQYYLRLSAASRGDSAESRVNITGFDYVKADTTISIARADKEDTMFLTIPPGTTYEQAAGYINDSTGNPGVTASVIDTGEKIDPFRLTLTSNATGEEHRISVHVQSLPMTEINGANEDSLNSSFSINGIAYQRQTNDAISDVIPGVTLNLKKIGETSVSILKDTDSVKETILSLVDNFNKLVNDIKGKNSTETIEGQEEEVAENPLSDSYSINNMLTKLQFLMTSSTNTASAYDSLADIGLEVNRDSTMKFNEDLLDQALASDADAVTSLFIGDTATGTVGLGDLINDGITSMINSSGVISTETDATQTRINRLDETIKKATEQLDKRYDTLTKDFVRLDTYIQRLNSESAFMSTMIESFNKTME